VSPGGNDGDDLRLNVSVAPEVDATFSEFAIRHAKELIGADVE